MTRDYDELVGRVFETVPPLLMLLLLLVVTAVVAALWYWWPRWVPRRLPRLRWRRPRLPRWRRRPHAARHGRTPRPRRRRPAPAGAAGPPGTVTGPSLADRLAAEGRYAEAIRERLRDTVGDLTRAGLVDPEPGTTAAEITTTAATGRPAVGPALAGATGLFSEIWYGHRPAGAPEDDRMRDLTTEIRDTLHPGAGR